MRPRRNHEYIPDENDPHKYIEYHVRLAVGPRPGFLEPTGRTFTFIREWKEPTGAYFYFSKPGEMLLWNYLTETCVLLGFNEGENDEKSKDYSDERE